MFSSRLPLPALISLCRTLHVGLNAGLSPVKVLRQQAKSGPTAARVIVGNMAERLKAGDSMEEALLPYRTKFPVLFLELVTVGEKAGKLPEVFSELERYYTSQQDSRRAFLQAIMWPAISYVAAVIVITLMTLILQLIGGAFDVLGLNKLGMLGPLLVFCGGMGFGGALAFFYFIARDNDDLKRKVEAYGLKVPGLAIPYRSFALYRYSLALSMTHEAGMRADEAVYSSFRATANAAYEKHGEATARQVRAGETITEAMHEVPKGLFPEEFLDSVSIGEDSGQISEVMGRVAEQYREDGIRQTKVLARIAGGAVYLMVALLIIVVIIRIVMSIAGVYADAMKGL